MAFETIITETNNLPASGNDQEQRSDWRDIEVEKLPVVLAEDLQLYEEIVIPCCEPTDLKGTNAKEEINLIEIENEHASTSTTNEPNIIINSNTKITSEQLTKFFPKNPTKQNLKPVAINQKINVTKKKNYYNDSDETLKIPEN
ncbi:unnamed protein product [Parnassius apollo]|uniref:(apollo) hypothetical protein n=1 Tax=Parnassius apollo TaxID=110799 RepID=A0A8S3W2G9_PARAO|nr:unnamed protein product [Parnassius apollo]